MMNLVLFGPPGSGKGTQATNLIEKHGLVHLSTGDLLRDEIGRKTALGISARQFMDKGELVPDEVVIGMIANKIEANKDSPGFIFDGFPRTVTQAKALDDMLKRFGLEIHSMISLKVRDKELINRLLLRGETSGRSDDQDETIIRNRIEEYNNKTAPVSEYYSKAGLLKEVHGEGTIDETFELISFEIASLN